MAVRNILKGSKKMCHISIDGFNVNIYFIDEIAKDCIQNEQHGAIFINSVVLHAINMGLLKLVHSPLTGTLK